MRVPLTPDGWREIALSTLVLGGAAVLLAWWFWPLAGAPLIVWVWVLSFFRDPERAVPSEPGILVAPADGRVTDVAELDRDEDIGGAALRIGIFMSIFSVHINRSPCHGRVRSIRYRKGEFVNALRAESRHRNEANTVVLEGEDGAPDTVVVRQIAGLIARRIVCHAKVGDRLTRGQRFGMIKFGSRTELIIPRRQGDRVLVAKGQGVYAGRTILVRLGEPAREGQAVFRDV